MTMEDGTDDLRHAPTLKNIVRSDPFVVPDGFFGRFPHTVAKQVIARPNLGERLSVFAELLWPLPRPVWATSLVLVVAAMAYWGLVPTNGNETSNNAGHAELILAQPDDHELIALLSDDAALWGVVGSGVPMDELEDFLDSDEMTLELLTELL